VQLEKQDVRARSRLLQSVATPTGGNPKLLSAACARLADIAEPPNVKVVSAPRRRTESPRSAGHPSPVTLCSFAPPACC
jgi:hypothetical protein